MTKEPSESEVSLYETIVNNSEDAIISKALDGTILSWNQGAEKIFGYAEKEILSKHISILVPKEKVNEDHEILERIKAGEHIRHYETERVKKDGSRIQISLTVSPIRDKEGKIIGASKIARDITEQKRRIDHLISVHKEIANYKYALDESCIVAITNQKGIISYVNDNFCRISKFDRDELIGQDHRIINSGHHTIEFIRDLWTTIAKGKIWRGELKNKAKDGSYYWVDTTIVPFLNNDGKPFQYIAIRSDITEKKRAEEKNLENQRRYEQVVENILDGLLIMNNNGKITFANKQFLVLFGINETALENMKLEDYLVLEYRDFLKESRRRRDAAEEMPFTFEYEGQSRNGTKIWLEVRICDVMEHNEITGLQYATRDITKQKWAESERMKVIADIVQRNKDLEQFSYIISHNLRSPVANILGISNLMDDDQLTEDEKTYLMESLTESIKRLDNIIIDLNHATQIKLSSTESKEIVKFAEIVDDITASISNLIDKNEVTIITDFQAIDCCYSVKSYIHSIFYNLITNSIKYKKLSQPLNCEIKSERGQNSYELCFKDNGLGIDLVHTGNQIFEIYKRFHIGAAEGKGMGLFMVKNHVESLGGTINVESELNSGTVFRIEFPLTDPQNRIH